MPGSQVGLEQLGGAAEEAGHVIGSPRAGDDPRLGATQTHPDEAELQCHQMRQLFQLRQ